MAQMGCSLSAHLLMLLQLGVCSGEAIACIVDELLNEVAHLGELGFNEPQLPL